MEKSVRDMRERLPENLRNDPMVAGAMILARQLDEGAAKDPAQAVREIRQCRVQLQEWSPGENKGDKTDNAKSRRERRLTLMQGGQDG